MPQVNYKGCWVSYVGKCKKRVIFGLVRTFNKSRRHKRISDVRVIHKPPSVGGLWAQKGSIALKWCEL